MIETTSLELSKKLVEAGVTGSHHFNWFERSDGAGLLSPLKCDFCEFLNHKMVAPAFTACELDRILPNEIDDGTGNYFIYRSGKFWGYRDPDGRFLVELQGTKPLAEKMGDLLLWLYENGHMEQERNEVE